MIHFENLIEKLRALENVRNVDMTSEEFSNNYPGSNLAPIPKMYSQSVDSPETISYELNIDPAIRSKVLALKKTKTPDEAVVYNPDTKKAEVIDKTKTNDYVQRGFKVIYEEANVAPVPGPAGFTNTSGSFDTVAGMDKRLGKKRNKRELDKFNGRTFDLTPDMFRRMKEGKERYSHWSQFIEEEEDGPVIDQIRSFSLRNPTSPVVIRDTESGEKAILRRKTNDSRLRHNRNKLKEETYLTEGVNNSVYQQFMQFVGSLLEGAPGVEFPLLYRPRGFGPESDATAGRYLFPMANAPQPLLDLFDYNGDGIIGYNDTTIVREIFSQLEPYFEQNGLPDELPTAAWYLENWESYNQEFGLELPDPSSWFFATDYFGNLFFQPDSQLPPGGNGGPDGYGGYENGLYEWQGTVDDWISLSLHNGFGSGPADGDGVGSYNGYLPDLEFIKQYLPDFYEFLVTNLDYDGDGILSLGLGTVFPRNDTYILFALRDAIGTIAYFQGQIPDGMGFRDFANSLSFNDLDALRGFDGANRFLQSLILTSESGSTNQFGVPDDIFQYEWFRELYLYFFPPDPNYGQVPTPPEETPIAQDPYQITQLPTPENP